MSRVISDFRRHPVVLSGLCLGTLLVVALTLWLLFGGTVAPTQAVDSGSGEELVLAQEGEGDDEADPVLDQASVEVTYDVFLSRDPFESIRPPEPVVTDAPTDDAGTGAPSPGAPSTGTTTENGTVNGEPSKDTTAQGDGVCRTGSEAVCDGNVVVLNGVSDGAAQVEVNGVAYTVVPGASFAGNFQLLRITTSCVDLLYLDGDEADTFQLCVGASVSK